MKIITAVFVAYLLISQVQNKGVILVHSSITCPVQVWIEGVNILAQIREQNVQL